ncbi:hypothetical protein PoB_000955100 [Plakobranchus ocellatus]|uniref:Uncharacterized protein n=1 Tax=Plakobranchus ocellatus TaxID=259542 RepID=A0AAV3Y707_9GAST|nr:hypothetical protein PoB_000955100 [Plakobranchus ocellatus]
MENMVAVVFLIYIYTLSIVSAQYDDFSRNLDPFFMESSTDSGPMRHVSSMRSGDNFHSIKKKEAIITTETTLSKNRTNSGIDFQDINSWDYVPAEFLGPVAEISTTTSPTNDKLWPSETFTSTTRQISRADTMPISSVIEGEPKPVKKNQNTKTDVQNSVNIMVGTNPHLDNLLKPGAESMPLSPDGMFLPLADHMAGASLSINPDEIHDWSALPLSEDTHKYSDPPTVAPIAKPRYLNGASFAEAILRGKLKRWKWSYVSKVLEGEAGSFNGSHGSADWISCCQRLPYICSMDAVCQLSARQCNDFCECAANPATPHCVSIIPEIKRTMILLEKKMLARIAREFNLDPLPDIGTTMPQWNYITESTPLVEAKSSTISISSIVATTTSANSLNTLQTDPLKRQPQTRLPAKSISTATPLSLSTYPPQPSVTQTHSQSFPTSLSTRSFSTGNQTLPLTYTSTRSVLTTKPTLAISNHSKMPQINLNLTTSSTTHSILSAKLFSSTASGKNSKTTSSPTRYIDKDEETHTNDTISFLQDKTFTKMLGTNTANEGQNNYSDGSLTLMDQNDKMNRNIGHKLDTSDLALEPMNAPDLIDTNLQGSLFSWFRSEKEDHPSFSSFSLSTNATPHASTPNTSNLEITTELSSKMPTATSDKTSNFQFCTDDCEIKGGTCVMGNDFRPHCIIVAADACEQFHCMNGE